MVSYRQLRTLVQEVPCLTGRLCFASEGQQMVINRGAFLGC